MFSFNLAQNFAKRAQSAMPFPRGLVSFQASAAAAARNPRIGALGAASAIALGGVMMLANFAHQRAETSLLVTQEPVTTKAPEVAKAAPVSALPVATPVAEAMPAIPVPVAKSAARIDMNPTGSIEKEQSTKLRHKAHPKKKKDAADNRN